MSKNKNARSGLDSGNMNEHEAKDVEFHIVTAPISRLELKKQDIPNYE